MVTSITFRGGEATGSVADRRIETAKQETTGGVGARSNNDSIFTVDNELKQDTVCFRGSEGAYAEPKKTSTTGIILGTLGTAAVVVGLLGLAHKYDLVGKIGNEKVQKFFRHTDVVTDYCHKACKWVKNNSYDKLVDLFKGKKM